MSDLVGNPGDRFSQNKAHTMYVNEAEQFCISPCELSRTEHVLAHEKETEQVVHLLIYCTG